MMIELTFVLLPESNLSLEQLSRIALPGVVGELVACGYAVAGTSAAGSGRQQEIAGTYQVHPGPASMTVTTDAGAGRLPFALNGAQFGKRVAGHDSDGVLWMRLIVLGMRLSQAHSIVARTMDPEQTGIIADETGCKSI
ncbi:hypothetical protein MMAG44476_08556 [Mycolicibacterium mageritense DSM 44476 = CIP 104973]|nr:hypothetical protein [Mycolicibacterium mageritense]